MDATPEQRRDFGGIKSLQAIVNALLMHGTEADWRARREAIAKLMYGQ
ncbi:MAG: hypothetical protein U0X75_26835 [Acidobacteriota bacterium]